LYLDVGLAGIANALAACCTKRKPLGISRGGFHLLEARQTLRQRRAQAAELFMGGAQ